MQKIASSVLWVANPRYTVAIQAETVNDNKRKHWFGRLLGFARKTVNPSPPWISREIRLGAAAAFMGL
jgi:hypothetical protein